MCKDKNRSSMLFGAIVSILLSVQLSTGSLVCSTKKSGQLYRVSPEFSCYRENYRSRVIQLQKVNIREYRSSARSLKVEEKICETYFSFVGTKVAQRHTVVKHWVNKDRYKHHIANESCEDLKGRTFTGGDQTPGYECKYSYLKHQSTTVLSCTHTKGSVVGSRSKMLRSDLGDVSHCSYQQGFCITGDGQAISWQPEPEEKSEYLMVGNFSAIMINEHHLMVDEVGLAFDLREMTKIDERTFLDKEFKVIFEREETQSENEGVLSMEDDALEAFKREITAKMQFLADKIAEPAAQVDTLCQAIEMNQKLSKMLAVMNPTQFMRSVLNETRLIAKAATSEYIMVWPCKEVELVTWRKIADRCFSDVPVTYTIDNFGYEGFLDPQSDIILTESTEIDCEKAPKTIFKTTEGTFIHSAGQAPIRINHVQVKTLPILKTNLTHHLFTMPENWVFNHTDLHHHNLEDAIFARMEKRLNNMEQGGDTSSAIGQTKKEEAEELLGFFGFQGKRFYLILEGLGVWFFRLLAFLGGYTSYDVYVKRALLHRRFRSAISMPRMPESA
ncbi:hypothetical protein ACHWQZ_G019325 [Mnemiopsis leidyi]